MVKKLAIHWQLFFHIDCWYEILRRSLTALAFIDFYINMVFDPKIMYSSFDSLEFKQK